MTFQQLQYVLEVGRTGSVTVAAKTLLVSSSSISISLNALEKELGYPLFSRTQKGLVPTDQGRQVLDYADQICRTHQLLTNVGREAVRTLRINCTDQPPIAKAVAQLMYENKDRTDLRIESVGYAGNESYRKTIERDVEICLSTTISYAMGSWEKRLRKGGLHQQVLKTVPAVVQVGPGHRLYDAELIRPYDLQDACHIDDPHNSQSGPTSFGGNIFIDPNRVLYLARHGIRREAIARGLGYSIGVMPPKDAQSPFRCIPLEGAFFHFTSVTSSQAPTQPEIMRLLQLAKQNLDEAYPDY